MATFTGCAKNEIETNCDEVSISAPANEIAAVQAYVQGNNITATQDLWVLLQN